METTKLSSKGQVIIPKSLRDSHHWLPGQEFAVIDAGDGVLLRAKRSFPLASLNDVAGILKYEGPPKSLEEMELAIQQGAMERRNGGG